jgi:hypothetical protein
MSIGVRATTATPDVILGLVPRTQGAAYADIGLAPDGLLSGDRQTKDLPPAELAERWVLGPSPRMTQVAADEQNSQRTHVFELPIPANIASGGNA